MQRSNALDECRFPMEIFELIFEELLCDERSVYMPSLKASALACKPLLHLCRPHIFSHVKYGPYGSYNRTRRNLAQLVTKQPIFQKYIKHITYVMDIENEPPVNERAVIEAAQKRYGAAASIRPARPASLADLGSVPGYGKYMQYKTFVETGGRVDEFPITLAYHLPHIQSLTFRHVRCHTTDSATHTPCIDKHCLAHLNIMFQEFSTLESMRSISVKGFADLVMWSVFDFPNLQHLHLDCNLLDEWSCPSIRERAEIELPPLSSTLKLKTITVRAVDNFAFSIIKYCNDLESASINSLDFGDEVMDHLDVSTRVTSFSKLHTIFTDHIRQWTHFCTLSDKAGIKAFPALRNLEVYLNDDTDNQATSRIIAHAPALEKFTFSTSPNNMNLKTVGLEACFYGHQASLKHAGLACEISIYDDRDPIISLLCDTLSKVRGQNVIEIIEIKLRYHRYMRGINIFVPKFEQWKRLDSLLMRGRAADFPHLRQVSVLINFLAGPVRPIRDIKDFWAGKEFLQEPLKRLDDWSWRCLKL
ncbi:hypothetical protein BJ165DRAFT_1608738 [Panaeolus papilionaceus]|nr:hypothetical protein BJ165DRAFT_1608738 [Panaeolus papilionaceus]